MQRKHWGRGASPRRHMAYGIIAALLVLGLAACNSAQHTSVKTKATVTVTVTATSAPTAMPLVKGWNLLASPGVGAEGNLVAVTTRAANDAWAVGSYEGLDSLQRTLVERWDGSRWTQTTSPSPGTKDNRLNAVAAASAAAAWAVGYSTPATGASQPLIEQWDGHAWRIVPNPVAGQTGTLFGVTAVSTSDAWAVGVVDVKGAQYTEHRPLLEHWNGSAWNVVSGGSLPLYPNGTASSGSLAAVTAISSSNVWAVGTVEPGGALIEHWNGSAWNVVPGASANQIGYGSLTSVSGVAANDVWAVGSGPLNPARGCGASNGAIVEHWDGSQWSAVPVTSPSGIHYGFSLSSVAAVSSADVWAVGSASVEFHSTSSGQIPLIEHWNGSTWSVASGPTNETVEGLLGVAAASSGMVWAVGQNESTNGPGPTQVEQWNGSQWSLVVSPSPGTVSNTLNAVTAISANDVWAVGSSANGTLTEHWNGSGWSVAPSPNAGQADIALNAVASTASNDVWAVGRADGRVDSNGTLTQGVIEHWNGTLWSLVPDASSQGEELYGVAALSATDAWAVGAAGSGTLIEHWDGAHWTEVAHPAGDALYSVTAISANNVWAVGGFVTHSCGGVNPALIEHWDGKQWTIVPNTPNGVLTSVSADAPNDVWAAGYQLMMHWNGTQWAVVSSASATVNGTLNGISANTPADVWAVGSLYSSQTKGTQQLVEHWNGTAWSLVPMSNPGLQENILKGITTLSTGVAWAVGYYGQCYGCGQQALIDYYLP